MALPGRLAGILQAIALLLALALTVTAFADLTVFDGRDLAAMLAWAAFLVLCWRRAE